MATCNRVVPVLNFLTSKEVDYYPDNCNNKDIEVLISYYFESNVNDERDGSDCESTGESARSNEGAK